MSRRHPRALGHRFMPTGQPASASDPLGSGAMTSAPQPEPPTGAAQAGGLRTERRMSHVFALDVPHHAKPLFITDAAVNIAPDLDTERDIVQNAIDLARALGITVRLPSTMPSRALPTHQGHLGSRRRRCRHPGGTRTRGRQYARQTAHLSGGRRGRGDRARGPRADHPHESCRQQRGASGVVRPRATHDTTGIWKRALGTHGRDVKRRHLSHSKGIRGKR